MFRSQGDSRVREDEAGPPGSADVRGTGASARATGHEEQREPEGGSELTAV